MISSQSSVAWVKHVTHRGELSQGFWSQVVKQFDDLIVILRGGIVNRNHVSLQVEEHQH